MWKPYGCGFASGMLVLAVLVWALPNTYHPNYSGTGKFLLEKQKGRITIVIGFDPCLRHINHGSGVGACGSSLQSKMWDGAWDEWYVKSYRNSAEAEIARNHVMQVLTHPGELEKNE